jgi:hypothetical protein
MTNLKGFKDMTEVATPYDASGFIETYTGRAFWPLKPTVEGLSIIDIAHALSNQCRYSGHVRFFYSVAQHCCLLAAKLSERGGSAADCLQLLMHDAQEAYLVDIPRPLKQFMPQYHIWEHGLTEVIREWLGWKNLRTPAIVAELDNRIIVDERAALMDPARRNNWGNSDKLEAIGVEIVPWTPEQAEKNFLVQYAAYSKEVYGTHQYINHDWGVPVEVRHEGGSDMKRPPILIEVDIRGGVGRMGVRSDEGMLARDAASGLFPRAQWEWQHGKFEVHEPTFSTLERG